MRNPKARITIYVDSPKGTAIDGIDLKATETHQEYVERVTKRILALLANPRA